MTLAASNTEKRQLRPAARVLRCAPVLLPLLILVGTGLRGLDFGLHWDEHTSQIGPVKQMVRSGSLLPDFYIYPSFDYWLNLLVLAPDVVSSRIAGESSKEHLLRTLDSHAYLMRLRAVYLAIASLSVVWIYLLVLHWRSSGLEALFAGSLLACSWEVAYHLRWVATDGILMQFAILTALLAAHALKSRRESWLMTAAAVAGLGCGTKYPGGLLVMPVALAGFFGATGCTSREKTLRLIKAAAVFVVVYLTVTPATILQPAAVADDMLGDIRYYATGHYGHTVGWGLEHAWRMLTYFATVFFSPYLAIALLMFALAIIGIASILARDSREGAVFLVFPAFYLLYFSMQRVMLVRNLLAVAPFLAVAAARGACAGGEFLGANRNEPAGQVPRSAWWRVWAGLLGGALCLNAFWLIASAESIMARHTDRFIREAAGYIRAHSNTRFFLSLRVKRDVAVVAPPLENVTVDPAEAAVVVLYAREGMRRWQDWPANQRGLTRACFGPREVNFNIYPNWWGDDRIVAIDRRHAERMGLRIAGSSEDTDAPPETVLCRHATEHAALAAPISADSWPISWTLPPTDPRVLIPRAEAEAMIGPLVRGPTSGGWELDGTACTYVGREGLVISVAIITTSAFDLERHDPQSVTISSDGMSAYAARTGALGDVRLFSRTFKSAVIVHVSGGSKSNEKRLDVAKQFASAALERLDAAQELSTLHKPRH
jgi:4-amino-4-deoxy-L-arabinose transferase-like glycosyltransferase